MPTMTDIEIPLEDRPGRAAAVGDALGAAGVNIDGVCAHGGSDGVIHVLVADEDIARARSALAAAGLTITGERQAHVVQCPDRPGEMGRVLGRLARADVNLDVVYLTTGGRLALAASDDSRLGQLLT
jgi:hypothetical protein